MATFAQQVSVRLTLQVQLDESERFALPTRYDTDRIVTSVTFKAGYGMVDVTAHRVKKDGQLYIDGSMRYVRVDLLPEWLQEQHRLYSDELARLTALVDESLRPLPEGGA